VPIENVDSPPNLPATLDEWLTQVLYRHVCVHTLNKSDSHCLSYLP
jgi:hypothetical protein